jgi:hypothetical protein
MRNRNTQSVIVFGATDAGKLALACLRGEPGWEIVAFADDAPEYRDSRFDLYPSSKDVIEPLDWDFELECN